jgi:hypothetical protein
VTVHDSKSSVGQTFRSGDESANEQQEPASPRFRPRERFWPYAELPENATPEEIAALDPELRDALYGATARPFSITLVFPKFEDPDYTRAVELARKSAQYLEVGTGDAFRVRARFYPQAARQLHELFEIVGPRHECEVLIDDKPFPFARELWLPLIWFLLPQD